MYEQDILRDPHSIKPWIAYIEHKQQYGTLYEQAFVSHSYSHPDFPPANDLPGDGACVQATSKIL